MEAESPVYAEVELVLVVGVVGGAGVVVGGSGFGGEREAVQQGDGGWVERSGDDVVGELGADVFAGDDSGGGGVVDLGDTGEDAVALVEGGDGGDDGAAYEGLDALVVAEEEQLVV